MAFKQKIHSAADEDKFEKFGVKCAPGDKVAAPPLCGCPANIECSVVDSIVTGSHEMFIGKVEAVHADEEIVNGGGSIDFAKIKLI